MRGGRRRALPTLIGTVLLAVSAVPARAASAAAPPLFGGVPAFPLPQARQTPANGITLPSAMTADPMLPSHERPATPGGDLAFGAFQRGYFATALSEAMKRLSKDPSDGPAMALIGEIYAQGLAVKRSDDEAARWNRLASQAGNREATFSYAMALLGGKGVAKDRAAAKDLLEKAAAGGHAGALYNLGVMAIEGEGTTRDFPAAAALFERAAAAGDVDALYALATLAASGRGVPLDLAAAASRMKSAADRKHVGAAVEYAIMLFNGKGVAKNEPEAARYFRQAAASGNPIAENRLARMYAAGRGVDKDLVEASHWHIMARAAGIPDPWLDDQLAGLSAADKAKVEDIIRRQIGP